MERANREKRTPKHWTSSKIEVAYLLALLGATDEQMAKVMEVPIHTINWWKVQRPEFYRALQDGKLGADTEVLKAAYKCAVGYEYEEQVAVYDRKNKEWVKTTIKKFRPPDPWSAFRWLSIRQRELWSETNRVEITTTQNLNFNVNILSTDELLMLEEISKKQLKSANDITEGN